MKQHPKLLVVMTGLLVLGLAAGLAWQNRSHRACSGERKPLFYQDSMHPWVKSGQPGKCTICAMDLTPIYEGEKGFGMSGNLVALSSNSITVLHVQGDEVKRQPLCRTLRVAGTLEANETRKAIVSAPAPCRIQALAVEYAGVEVEEGQALITLFSPELVQKRSYLRSLGAVQAGMSDDRSQAMAKADPYSSSLVAPISGIVVERNVYQGQYVPEGEKLLTIVDASVLWFRFDVYQRQLPWFKLGQTIEVEVEGVPTKVFTAVISFLEPTLNDAARTIKVRADIKNPVVATKGNPLRLLRFGMYAEGHVRSEIPDVLAVPRTAILFPGGAAYAYVDRGDGAYERRRVKLGRQGDEFWEVLQGLEEGDRVVTSGNVLIDAQAQFNQGSKTDDDVTREVAAAEPQDDSAKTAGEMHQNAGVHVMPTNPGQEMPVMAASEMTAPPIIATAAGKPGMGTDVMQSNSAQPVARGNGMQVSTNKTLTHRGADGSRMALRDELRLMRTAAIVEAIRQKTEAPNPPAGGQPKTIAAFLQVADEISRALASDNLEQFNQCMTNLARVLPPLEKEFVTPHRWSGPIQRLAVLQWHPAKEMNDARKQFLPFSTLTVEWAKELRKEDPAFAGLKVYHCPMAPKPGLWLQAKAPLANPFYGAEMLRCGEEVKP